MNGNWFLALLEEVCLFLRRNPAEILLPPVGTFLIFLFLRLCVVRICSKIIVNWPVVGMLPMFIANRHRLLDHITTLLREAGHTFVFKGPWFSKMNYLFTCDPKNSKHLFVTNIINYPKGDEFKEIFDSLGSGIVNSDGHSWMIQRKVALASMSIPWFRSSVEECTKEKLKPLLPLLNQMAEFDEIVDLSNVIMRFMFDTTCALFLGVDPGYLASEILTIPFAEATQHGEEVIFFRHTVPMIWWKLLRWLRMGEELKMAKATEVGEHFLAQCIQKKRLSRQKTDNGSSSTDKGPIDLLSLYMDHPIKDICEAINTFHNNDKFLRDSLVTFMTAGKDTTGSAIAWFLWLVASNQHVQNKLFKELKNLRPFSNSKEQPRLNNEMVVFDYEEINSLVYLHAALCETLRLYPSVPFNHKVALKADTLPSGHKVKPGMAIIFSMYSMGRMKEIWGEDCLDFKPERWITENGALRDEPSYKLIAFHAGPRSCLGKSMAITQIKLVVAAMIYNFNIQIVEGHVAEPKLSVVLQMKKNLLLKLKKRE